MMRLSCLSLSFQNQFRAGKMDIFSFMTQCRALNFDGIDPHVRDLGDGGKDMLKKTRRRALDNGLSISSICVTTEFGRNAAAHPAEIEKAKKAMETGMFLGAPICRVFVGSAPSPDKTEDAFRWSVDALRKCAEIGADLGILVALQNHSGLTSTGDDMLRFHKEVNHPNFSLLLDTGHFTGRNGPNGPKREGHTYDTYYRSIEQVAPIARFVRAKLYQLDERGKEQFIDYNRVFNILRAVHYNGFVSLVYEGKEDELAAIPRGTRFLRSFVSAA
ncbi:MAG: sugar phosphate isomerase/epimerase [Acidobacteria bacterium]|nr:sugar phosphate isomerase/epimerase [Acidobacteriota bacterium]